jgi:hypothetical protein
LKSLLISQHFRTIFSPYKIDKPLILPGEDLMIIYGLVKDGSTKRTHQLYSNITTRYREYGGWFVFDKDNKLASVFVQLACSTSESVKGYESNNGHILIPNIDSTYKNKIISFHTHMKRPCDIVHPPSGMDMNHFIYVNKIYGHRYHFVFSDEGIYLRY